MVLLKWFPSHVEGKRDRKIGGLVRALKNKDYFILEKAILALGDIKDPRMVTPLLPALTDEHPDVRREVARSLAKLTASQP